MKRPVSRSGRSERRCRRRAEGWSATKHGSRLNMAEIEFSVLARQCLARRIDNLEEMRGEVGSWRNQRNNANAKIDWRFTSEDARIKRRRLYPTFQT